MPHFVGIWQYRRPNKFFHLSPVRSSHADTKFEGISLLYHEHLSAASLTSVGSGCWVWTQPSSAASLAVMLWIWNDSGPSCLTLLLVSGRWKFSHLVLWFPLSGTGNNHGTPWVLSQNWGGSELEVRLDQCPDLTSLSPEVLWSGRRLWWFAEPLKTLHINFGCMAKIM